MRTPLPANREKYRENARLSSWNRCLLTQNQAFGNKQAKTGQGFSRLVSGKANPGSLRIPAYLCYGPPQNAFVSLSWRRASSVRLRGAACPPDRIEICLPRTLRRKRRASHLGISAPAGRVAPEPCKVSGALRFRLRCGIPHAYRSWSIILYPSSQHPDCQYGHPRSC